MKINPEKMKFEFTSSNGVNMCFSTISESLCNKISNDLYNFVLDIMTTDDSEYIIKCSMGNKYNFAWALTPDFLKKKIIKQDEIDKESSDEKEKTTHKKYKNDRKTKVLYNDLFHIIYALYPSIKKALNTEEDIEQLYLKLESNSTKHYILVSIEKEFIAVNCRLDKVIE